MNRRDFLWVAAISFVFVVGVSLIWCFWDDLHDPGDSVSTTIRSVSLVLGGTIALLLAVWRSIAASSQAATAQQSMLNDRYQRSSAMLESNTLSVRIAGIYALEQLATEHASDYHIVVVNVLCSFIRFPTEDSNFADISPDIPLDMLQSAREVRGSPRPDVAVAWQTIASRISIGISIEQNREFVLYLRNAKAEDLQVQDAKLSGAWLTRANLSGAILPRADLSNARLRKANLSKANLRNANLSHAKLWGTDMSGAILQRANLSGTDFAGVTARSPEYGETVQGLTQKQLSEAYADPSDPPKLGGVVDAVTGQPLTWP